MGAAVATGSHLDSVPDGGAYDGPLGVVSAFAAIDELRAEGFTPSRPIAVAAFTEEEGARFGVACLGSRLLTGAIDPGEARELRDGDGITLAEAMHAAGQDPGQIGRDEDLLAQLGGYVELHIEQGRALADLDAALGIAEGIWPHGRWRLDFAGQADHAGTAALADRRDPMIPYAATVLAAREAAIERGARATIGKVTAEPGAANAVCSAVRAWLDVRAPDGRTLEDTVDQILAVAGQESGANRVEMTSRQESFSPEVEFDPDAGRPARGGAGGARHRGAGTADREPGTTRGCWPPGCPPRCCLSATPPGCHIHRPSTPRTRTARPGSPGSRPCCGTWPADDPPGGGGPPEWRRRAGAEAAGAGPPLARRAGLAGPGRRPVRGADRGGRGRLRRR